MGYDKRGILRGQCSLCDCDEFESSGVCCDYSGHTPVDHLPLEPVTKRSRADNSLPKQDEVGEIQLHPADQPSSSKSTDNENASKEIKIIDLECETPTGVQTISNDGASEKAVEMGVLHTDPDNNDNEVRSLQKRVDSLASDKEVFEIRRRNIATYARQPLLRVKLTKASSVSDSTWSPKRIRPTWKSLTPERAKFL